VNPGIWSQLSLGRAQPRSRPVRDRRHSLRLRTFQATEPTIQNLATGQKTRSLKSLGPRKRKLSAEGLGAKILFPWQSSQPGPRNSTSQKSQEEKPS